MATNHFLRNNVDVLFYVICKKRMISNLFSIERIADINGMWYIPYMFILGLYIDSLWYLQRVKNV